MIPFGLPHPALICRMRQIFCLTKNGILFAAQVFCYEAGIRHLFGNVDNIMISQDTMQQLLQTNEAGYLGIRM